MKYCKIDSDGEIIGFLESDIEAIPDLGVFEIPPDILEHVLRDHCAWKVVNGSLTLKANVVENERVSAIKNKANEAIITIAPEWKQRNLIARGLELTEIIAGGGVLTTEQNTESTAIKLIWTQIKGVRVSSDQAETNGVLAENFTP